MKKYLKACKVVIGLPILYQVAIFISTILYSFVFVFYQSATTNSVFSEAEMQSKIVSEIYIIVFIAEIIMLLVLFSNIKSKLIKKGSFKKISLRDTMYMCILGVGMSGMICLVSSTLINIFPSYMEVSNSIKNATGSYLQLFIIVIFGPIFEEIFFRGIIFGYLKKNFNIIGAVIVQALVFAIVHGNIVQGIYAFIMGIVIALAYMHYDSLLASIVIHIITNLFGSVVICNIVGHFENAKLALVVILAVSIICILIPSIKMIKERKCRLNEQDI